MTKDEVSVYIDGLLEDCTQLRRQQHAAGEQLSACDTEGRLPSP